MNSPGNNNINPHPQQQYANPMAPNYGPVSYPAPAPGYAYYPPQGGQVMPGNMNRTIGLREINRRIPSHEGTSWSSVELRPKHVRFATQNKGEKVYVLVRRHWASNLGWASRNFFYSFIPPIVIYLLNYFNIESELITAKNIFLICLMYYSVILTTVIKEFFDWYFDPYIVTNERVLDYDFRPFTSYTVQEAGLDKIEDVKEVAIGFLPSIFSYGDVHITTASKAGVIIFHKVDNPTQVRDIISDLANIAKNFRE